MEENNKGKKPILISGNKQDEKRTITINNEKYDNTTNKTGFVRNKSFSNKYLYIILFLVIVILFICFGVINKKVNVEEIKNSVVMITVYDQDNNEISTGSGFCAYKSNYIVTNFHVIEGAYKIKITTDDNNYFTIDDILIFSAENDLAIIKGNFELKPLEIGSINKLKAGQEITTIGSPKGQLNTVSTGVISNADNDYEIRITAPISPGSSGGALIDNSGKVIGITYATYNSIDSQNINYAISVKYLTDLYNALNNDKYTTIKEGEYNSYTPDITNGTAYFLSDYFGAPDELTFKGKLYYSTSDLKTFYEATSKYEIFDRAMNSLGEYSLKDIYNNMSQERKNSVINNYEYLQSFNSYDLELSKNISSWTMEQFILELKLMQGHE